MTKTYKAASYSYQPYYCEENIWHLCQHPSCTDSTVIFIASHSDVFPMLCQRAMPDPSTPLLWDYHVVLLLASDTPNILDFDTTLPFCSELRTYLAQSFLDESMVAPEYAPYFRLVSAADYIQHFHSDRSHMKTANGWNAPPPNWPTIGAGGSNLTAFTDMQRHEFGEVLSRAELAARYLAILPR